MADTASDPIRMTCSCGTRLKAPAHTAGRRIKCPKCAKVLDVPVPEPAEPEVDDVPEEGDPSALLEELAAQARAAPSAAQHTPADRVPCPNCSAGVSPGDATCAKCGFDLRQDRLAQLARAESAAKAKRVAGKAGRAGLGMVCSAVGALVGAGVWYSVTIATGRVFGWMACGVGVLAGAGMVAGNRGPTVTGAVFASGMGVLGIVVGKLMVFYLAIVPIGKAMLEDIDAQRIAVADLMTRDEMDKQGVHDTEREGVYRLVQPEAAKIVNAMSDEDVSRVWEDEYRDRVFEELASSDTFYKAMFGFLDVVFIILALASAYGLAGSGIVGGSQ